MCNTCVAELLVLAVPDRTLVVPEHCFDTLTRHFFLLFVSLLAQAVHTEVQELHIALTLVSVSLLAQAAQNEDALTPCCFFSCADAGCACMGAGATSALQVMGLL